MSRARFVTLLSIIGLAVPLALPQQYDNEDERRPRRKQAIPEAGFWPTQRTLELFIDRMTEKASGTLNFDDDQLYQTQELFKERVIPWLNDNRGELTQISNEYFEMLLDRKAPDPEVVARWSTRLLPLLDEFSGVFEGTVDEMRTFLTEDQQVYLDAQMAAWDVGKGYVNRRLGGWAEGEFDSVRDWHRNPEFHDDEKKRRKKLHIDRVNARDGVLDEAGYGGGPGATPRAETVADVQRPRNTAPRGERPTKDAWTQYVENFIKQYQLNGEQQDSARRFLKKAQEDRDSYLRRNADRLAAAQLRLRQAKTDGERARAQEAVTKHSRPVKRMFQQLKDRLSRLPTRKQRLAAAQTELKRGATSKPDDDKSTTNSP